MEEIWKDIKDYEGYYQVSNLGRVKSLDRYIATVGNPSGKRLIRGKILNPSKRVMSNGEDGYYSVTLYKRGIGALFNVHRLVAETFIPNPNNLPCVNHKDENKHNNMSDNLEWCTIEYNNKYGTARERSGEKTRKEVIKFDLDGNILKVYKSLESAAKEEKVSKGNLANVCVNRNGKKTLHGYVFMYKDDYNENGFVGYENTKTKKVNQYDLDGNLLNTFESVRQAYASTGRTTKNGAANITAVCRDRQNSAYGYKWAYAN